MKTDQKIKNYLPPAALTLAREADENLVIYFMWPYAGPKLMCWMQGRAWFPPQILVQCYTRVNMCTHGLAMFY